MTSEKFITFLSTVIVLITIAFSSSVFIKELLKPSDILERIILEKCTENKIIENTVADQNELEQVGSDCVFIPDEFLNSSEFTKNLKNLSYLRTFDYLFSGKKGILLKKNMPDHKKVAASIFRCFRSDDCSNAGEDEITVTYLMQDKKGNAAVSTTYNDLPVKNTVKAFRKLYKEMLSIKKLSEKDLTLTLMFHREYTFLEDKTLQNVIPLLKRSIDGLFLKSRGAKIRVLPWEYSDNPVNVMDRKGRQYGLDKEEYKKDEASIYHYRTVQFIEKNGEMIPWLGIYSDTKRDYSGNLAIMLISKHLKNIQLADGSFPAEMDILEGIDKKSKEILNIQAETAVALFKAADILQDSSLADSSIRTISYLMKKSSSAEISQAILLDLLTICENRCTLTEQLEKKSELMKFFSKIENIKNGISANPVYSGIFLKAFLIASEKGSDSQEIGLLKDALDKYSGLNRSDKLRFISYLMWADYKKGSESFGMVKDFLNSQTGFIKDNLFDDRGFNDFSGSFVSSEKKSVPDTAVSALISSGLSKAVLFEYHNETVLEMESASGNFLRYLIVTDDDFPNWGNAQAKTSVQGGVRTFPGAETVKLANSARVLEYFVNRAIKGKTR